MIHYHIYNRGAHKFPIFNVAADFERFQRLLYVGNDELAFKHCILDLRNVFSSKRKKPLLEILAYCLMPNHFHIALRSETVENVTHFMRKICTGYSMYFNLKYSHSGTIFQGSYKNKIIEYDGYLERLIDYIHINPYGLLEPNIPRELHKNPDFIEKAKRYSKEYEYSSWLGIKNQHLKNANPYFAAYLPGNT